MKRTAALVVIALVLCIPWPPDEASPATLQVDDPGDDLDLGPNGNCTLREAVLAANTNTAVDACGEGDPGPGTVDVIVLPAGAFTLSIGPAGDDVGTRGDLDLNDDVEIRGAGPGATSIDGDQLDRVLEVHPGVAAAITDLSITGGAGAGPGGGLRNHGTLTLDRAAVSGNTVDGLGGGIRNDGDLTVVNSTLSGNAAPNGHGGAIDDHGTATFISSTVSGNMAGTEGGGLYNLGGQELTVVHSTLTGNTAPVGGGIFNDGALTLTGTLVAGGCAGSGAVTTTGGNLESPGDTCGLGAADLADVADPLLGPLADNGGPTATHALLPGSPAIDFAPNGLCPAVDQRGAPRPVDGDGDSLSECDSGAFEFGSDPTNAIFVDGFESGNTSAWSASVP